MPLTRGQTLRVYARSRLPWRRLLGHRTVRRRVQGVDLLLPWSHLLPDYARIAPAYGQNLVALAVGLQARAGRTLQVLDIGANVGDSALQVVAATDARVLCVEGDPYWAGYLRRNVDGDPRITVEAVLLTTEPQSGEAARAVRKGGTTHFVTDVLDPDALPALSVRELQQRQPDFAAVRLVKSDTDGLDTVLVPAVAQAWPSDAVLFFEYDPALTRAAGYDPQAVWTDLAALGYSHLAVWDNVGHPLGQLEVTAAAGAAQSLEPPPLEHGYHYWDVAACRTDDAAARAVFDDLVPGAYA